MKNLKTYKIFLDDIRKPIEAYLYTHYEPLVGGIWEIVRDYDQFTDFIERNYKKGSFPEIISFDHDLAPEHYAPQEHWDDKYDAWADSQGFKEKTGMDCAKWLVDFCLDNDLKLPEYHVHSMNPAGRANIQSLLDNFKKFQENE